MKKLICLVMLMIVNLVMADLEVKTEGAAPGIWTMDMDAALLQAQAQQKPVLILFTGSDWCSWCKKLEKKILTQDAWKDFARKNLFLVYVDFPQDKSKVPEKYRQRNDELGKKYHVKGYPTLLLLDENGKQLGNELRYEDSLDKFIFMAKQPLRFQKAMFAKITKDMPADELNAFQQNQKQLENNKQRINELKTQIVTLVEDVESLEKKIDRELDDWIVKSRLPQKYDDYKKASTAFYSQLDKFMEWVKSGPEENDETMKKAKEMQKTLQTLEKDVTQILAEAWKTLE